MAKICPLMSGNEHKYGGMFVDCQKEKCSLWVEGKINKGGKIYKYSACVFRAILASNILSFDRNDFIDAEIESSRGD